MMKSIMGEFAQNTSKVLTKNIKEVAEDLEFKLEKTCVPRPSIMGMYNYEFTLYFFMHDCDP